MSIKKQPYEISLWRDIHQPGTNDYEPYLDEEKIAIIGSDTMTAPYRAHSPQFTKNMNGTLKLTFTMYLRYYNEETGTYDMNPYSKSMVNEAKIKLKRREKGEDKWYDLVIKNIQESSDKNSMIYTCESQAISELSKTGFKLEFKNDLLNNIDTLPGFTERVLAETDWKLEKPKNPLQEKREEPVVKMKITGNFKAHNMENNEKLQDVWIDSNNGETCYFYCSYSSFSNKADRVFFLYRVKQDYKSDKSTRVLKNAACLFIEGASWTEIEENGEKKSALVYQNQIVAKEVEVSSEFRGKFYVRNQKTVHEPITDKIVNVYEDKDKQIVYGYTETDYSDPGFVQNIITNGDGLSWTSDGATGWNDQEDFSSGVDTVYTDGYGKSGTANFLRLNYSDNGSTFSSNGNENMSPYLSMYFTTKGNGTKNPILNTGLSDQLSSAVETSGFRVGDKYVFRIAIQKANKLVGTIYNTNISDITIGSMKPEEGPRLCIRKFDIGSENQWIFSDDEIYFDTRNENFQNVLEKEDSGYCYIIGTFSKALSYDTLLKERSKYGIFFYDKSFEAETNYIIKDVQFFKYNLVNGQLVIPDSNMDYVQKSSINETYFYPPQETNLIVQGLYNVQQILDPTKDHSAILDALILKKEDITFYSEIEGGLTPIYDITYEKHRSIDVSESNRFNIIQSLCEKFETWVDFRIDHEADGKIKIEDIKDSNGKTIGKRQAKYVTFFDYINEDIKYPEFKYGINLNSIQRTVASDQIVSKIIVKNNSNSLAKNGICTIARAKDNPTGENFFYDFSYYINQKMIPYETVIEDLYGKGKYYETYKSYNKQQQVLAEEISELSIDLAKYESVKTVSTETVKAMQEEISNLEQQIELLRGKRPSPLLWWKEEYQNNITETLDLKRQKSHIECQLSNQKDKSQVYLDLCSKRKSVYLQKKKDFDAITKKKEELNKKFYSKYSRFIQEGSWVSNDYVDDDLYYYDAQNVLSTSTQPKVSYSLSVIDVSPLDGYEAYSYDIGDHTYIEDTEFFGWLSTKDENGQIINTPYREEVIVSEITNDLDSPENNKITIQNYKTNFQDLFQRITATTQSLQFAKGDYNRAANTINPDGTFDADYLQNTLLSKAFTVLNPENESIKWDANGIQVIDKRNPNNIIKLSSGMISISDTGGKDWATAISAKGINIGLMTSGVINTDKIYIGNEKNFSFRWDSTGLNAYTKKTDNKGNELDTYNYGKFVRFDRFGLYGYSEGEVFVPKNISEVEQSANFGLTWNGFFLKSEHPEAGGGSVKISKDNDIQVFGSDKKERLKIGYLGLLKNEDGVEIPGKYLYGIRVKNNDEVETVTIDSTGNIKIMGTIDAVDGKIGGWTIKNNSIETLEKVQKTLANGTIQTFSEGIILSGGSSKICSQQWEASNGGDGWCITNDEAIFNNITARGTISCAVFSYGEIKAVGGICMIRPSSKVKKFAWDDSRKSYYTVVEEPDQFSVDDICQFSWEVPEFKKWNQETGKWDFLTFDPYKGKETAENLIIESGINTNYTARITSVLTVEVTGQDGKTKIAEKRIYLSMNGGHSSDNGGSPGERLREKIEKGDTVALIDHGVAAIEGDPIKSIALGLNSSDNHVILPKRSFSVCSFMKRTASNSALVSNPTKATGTGNWYYYKPRIILGEIPNDRTIFNERICGKYGLYADAVQLTGDITATTGHIGSESAGWEITENRMVCTSDTKDSNGNIIGYYETGFSAKHGLDYAMWSGFIERATYDKGDYRKSLPFRVGHDGTLWATKGYIGNWVIASTEIKNENNRNCLYYKTQAQPEILLHPTGTIGNFDPTDYSTGFKVGNSGNRNGWVFLVGNIKNDNGGPTLGYNFGVTNEGTLWAQGAQINGNINAGTGHIGGWEISDYTLVGYNIKKDSICVGLCSTPGQNFPAFWAGGTGNYVSQSNYDAKFWVTHDGNLTANDATIKGKIITSNDSNQTLIGNWRITSNGVLVGTRKISENSNQQTFILNPSSLYSNTAIAIGTPSDSSNVDGEKAVFFVDHQGNMRADNAQIKGSITANSGTIGSWVISKLKSNIGILHSDTGLINSEGKLAAPDILLCAKGTNGSLVDGTGYYVNSTSYSDRNGWVFLANRVNDTSYAYKFGIKNNGMLYTIAGAKIGNWTFSSDGSMSATFSKDSVNCHFNMNVDSSNILNSIFYIGIEKGSYSDAFQIIGTRGGDLIAMLPKYVYFGGRVITGNYITEEGYYGKQYLSTLLSATLSDARAFSVKTITHAAGKDWETKKGEVRIYGVASNTPTKISGVRIIGEEHPNNTSVRFGTISFGTVSYGLNSNGDYIAGEDSYLAKIMCFSDETLFSGSASLRLAANAIEIIGNYEEAYGKNLSKAAITVSQNIGHLYGSWYTESAINISSDRNAKNSISYLSDNYSTLFDSLIPVTYKYNNGQSNRTHTGFIAQDVESAIYNANLTTQDFAAFVKNENGEYFLRYEEFVALNTSEIQKLKRRILALENKIKELSL